MKISTSILLMLIAAAVAFYGGMKYGSANAPVATTTSSGRNNSADQTGGGNGGGRFGGRNGQNLTSGDVLSKDAQSFSLKLRDGGSKIIFYSTSTTVGKMVDGSLDDVKVGSRVMVGGAANPDGSLNAQMIQLRSSSNQ